MSDKAPDPWDRQNGESLTRYRYFCYYRDMGGGKEERSIAKLARELGISKNTAESYSRNSNWVKRAEAWDVELDRRVRSMTVGAVVGMRLRHADLSQKIQRFAEGELDALVEQQEVLEKAKKDNGEDARNLVIPVKDLTKLMSYGVSLERLVRGEPTDHLRMSQDDDLGLEHLDAHELRELHRIRLKMAGNGEEEAEVEEENEPTSLPH
jgi:hypothetical protein